MKKLLIILLFTLSLSTVSIAQRHQIYFDGFEVQVMYKNVQTGNTYSNWYFLCYKNYDKWDEITFFNKKELELHLKNIKRLFNKNLKQDENIDILSTGVRKRFTGPIIRLSRTMVQKK